MGGTVDTNDFEFEFQIYWTQANPPQYFATCDSIERGGPSGAALGRDPVAALLAALADAWWYNYVGFKRERRRKKRSEKLGPTRLLVCSEMTHEVLECGHAHPITPITGRAVKVYRRCFVCKDGTDLAG